jgi:molybdenum cofactor guanylyltransferase
VTGGVILAGGRSRRMGTDKAMLDIDGRPLIEVVRDVVTRTVDGPVIVVAATGQQLPPGLEVVRDAHPDRGPLEGMLAGLNALAGEAETAYVCAVDLPFLIPEAIRRPLQALACGAQAAVPIVGGMRQPLAAAYTLEVTGYVEQRLAGDRRSLMGLLKDLRVVEVPADDLAAALRDVDAPEDL